jgi:GTP-binding protein HflX
VALVGYTNAGKSTLLNALSDSDVYAENVLFATLDPTTRVVTLPEGQRALLTDTVGFIQRLPTQLVAAFRATLEEIQDADVLAHVLDLTHPNAEEQSTTVDAVLKELGVSDKPKVVALNKIDRLFPDLVSRNGSRDAASGSAGDATLDAATISATLSADLGLGPGFVPVSAKLGWGLDDLLKAIQETLSAALSPFKALIPYSDSELVALVHEKGIVEREDHTGEGTVIEGRLPKRLLSAFSRFAVE